MHWAAAKLTPPEILPISVIRKKQNIAVLRSPETPRLVLLELSQPQPIILEGSSVDLWDLFDGKKTVNDVASYFSATDHERIIQDITDFSRQLIALGYLAVTAREIP